MATLRVRYQTYEFGSLDIHIRSLRDRQQFSDDNGVAEKLGICSASWPMFGVVWDSSEILAGLMLDYNIEGKRVLEVGCGLGLSSLVLNHRLADISATDHHPEAGAFLLENSRLNLLRDIPFERTGWQDTDDDLGKFDLIIGSDLLYEIDHVELLSEFINAHAKLVCEVIIIDPGRAQHARFSKKMNRLGYEFTKTGIEQTLNSSKSYQGHLLQYSRH